MASSSPGSRITHHAPALNANTCVPGALPAVPPSTIARELLREAYGLAEKIAQAMPPMVVPGYRLFSIIGSRQASIDLPASEGAYTIVGRHTCCDLVLDRDPEVALRHLLIRAEPAPEGGTLLRVLDLNTSLPVELQDGSPLRSMLASGPVALRFGSYGLVALPSGVGELPKELPPPVVEHCAGPPYRSLASRRGAISHISLLPRAPMLDEVRQPITGFGRITLAGPRGDASVEVSEAELEKGVLIGRAPKCHARLSAVLDTNVSRVHLLLLREGGELFAYDLCSMNGTFAGRDRARRTRLSNRGAALSLGTSHIVLHWVPRR